MTEAELAEQISSRETFRLLGRSLRFVWPYRRQIGVKLALTLLGLSIVLFLPWPIKILIDHVVMGLPVGSSPTPYPPYVGWFVDLLDGLTPFDSPYGSPRHVPDDRDHASALARQPRCGCGDHGHGGGGHEQRRGCARPRG